jgi:hypothetical protein
MLAREAVIDLTRGTRPRPSQRTLTETHRPRG